jgi:hypothetical protein
MLSKRLSELWETHTRQNETTETMSMVVMARSGATGMGFDSYDATTSRESLAAARQLWSQTESLVIAAADVDPESQSSLKLLGDCKKLLTACDELVSSQEQLLQLFDMSAQTYVIGHECDSDAEELEQEFI